MSWDHPVHSFSYPTAEPQTPTRTPTIIATTAVGLSEPAFQTPKLESSFFDPRVTWDTADPYASSPEFLRTPLRFGLHTPSNPLRIPDSLPEGERENGKGDTARRIRAARPNASGGALPDGREQHQPQQQQQQQGGREHVSDDDYIQHLGALGSAAVMQTPPPTSASVRKVTGVEKLPGSMAPGGNSSSSNNNNNIAHLETPSRLLRDSPRIFGNLQSSPDFFQLAAVDPSASPFFPQHRLFWDQEPEPHHSLDRHTPLPPLPTTSIPPTTNPNTASTTSTATANATTDTILPAALAVSSIPQLPEIGGSMDLPEFGEHHHGFGMASTGPSDAALFPAPFSTSPRLPMTKAEDPALFLSSPARRFGGPQPTPQKGLFSSRPTRQPYHHQTEESKREELRRVRQLSGSSFNMMGSEEGHYNRGPDNEIYCNDDNDNDHDHDDDEEEEEDDDFTPRQMRPGLTRSMTHHAVPSSPASRPASLYRSSSGMMASTSGIRKSPSKGRLSPIKTMRQPLPRAHSMAGGFPTRSSSVVLTIGKDGRATTAMMPMTAGSSTASHHQTTTGLTDPIMGMDLDGSVTGSESDSAEYSDYPIVHHHHHNHYRSSSSWYPGRSESRPHSKGSYTSIASSHSGRHSPWAAGSSSSSVSVQGGGGPRRSTSLYRPSPDDWRRTTPQRHSTIMLPNSDFTYGSLSVASEALADPDDEDSGDAQHALRKVLQGKGRSTAGAGLLRHSQSVNYGSRPPGRYARSITAHLRSSPPRFGSELTTDSNTSPTTVTDPDLATPSTDRHCNPSNGTRCICHSMDNGGHLMIQCESCNHWLHTKCVGLERANLPSVYVCVFCAQTPSRSLGRNRPRDPMNVPTSPLAHKSFRLR
ncbi:hypothetical protein ASPZODRAFT_133649 [Penicilliopsis zonata CBS 506.65]|uniref:PHD-type domain-containing protein n=1 Tax=Penicilliopsis zonata CBS 506.65 TaxID=1073090 RepID=A0A1L9SEZ2_9EURO|nr:hypothetical protein ASPZODRAFT_133649 [Penicilliopsis zonata CBS 506.65]OJJ45780.1 hypothetical protein ASPZODRAFT_133649 [Penicilliopsis zonata CBS 506.65]